MGGLYPKIIWPLLRSALTLSLLWSLSRSLNLPPSPSPSTLAPPPPLVRQQLLQLPSPYAPTISLMPPHRPQKLLSLSSSSSERAFHLMQTTARKYFISTSHTPPGIANPSPWCRPVHPIFAPALTENEKKKEIIDQLQNYDIKIGSTWGSSIFTGNGWEIGELQTILEVVEHFTELSGSITATRQALGGVIIQQIPGNGGGRHLAPVGLIQISKGLFHQGGSPLQQQWGAHVAVAHELAHYWAWKNSGTWLQKALGFPGNMVNGLTLSTRNEPGPTWWARNKGPVEDWAESVAGYLYPQYFSWLRENLNEQETATHVTLKFSLPGLGPHHEAYITEQFYELRNQ